jgi:hypothetical protein
VTNHNKQFQRPKKQTTTAENSAVAGFSRTIQTKRMNLSFSPATAAMKKYQKSIKETLKQSARPVNHPYFKKRVTRQKQRIRHLKPSTAAIFL